MNYQFSKTTGNFYPDAIAYDAIPEDAITVTQAEFELAANRESGATLDVVGGVLAIVPPPLTPSPVSWETYRRQAENLMDATDKVVLRCLETATAIPSEWAAYRSALRAIIAASSGDTSAALPEPPAWPAGI